MTIRPRAVKALRDVRERLRDAAAASHAHASSALELSQIALAEERRRFEDFLDEAPTTLTAARTVYDLEEHNEDTGVHRLAIVDAAQRHDEDSQVTNLTALKLRERTRQLRSAEKLVEMVDDQRSKADARVEQAGNDDLASRRRR
ncbi:MAG: hypothetical protein ABI867_00010 [Kofleriaceae bacterium]